MVGASRFVAERVAAIGYGAYVEVSARSADQTLVLLLPSTLGDSSCAADGYPGSFAYYQGDATEFHNRPAPPARPGCTVSLVTVGNVGERIEGSFSATVLASSLTPTALQLTNGTFSVERVAFP
jgi:hypothetical protein